MGFPFFAREFDFTQPDGRSLKLRGWGDQDNARFETLDGQPVLENPETGFYEFAIRQADGRYAPSGLVPGRDVLLEVQLEVAPGQAWMSAPRSQAGSMAETNNFGTIVLLLP